MKRLPGSWLPLIGIVIIALIISACNYPGSDGESTEAAATDEREEDVTEEVDLDPDSSEVPPTDDSGAGGDGPPTPDLSDVDPMGGHSPIVHLSPSDTPLTLTYLWMQDMSSGWAIGDVDGTADHVKAGRM